MRLVRGDIIKGRTTNNEIVVARIWSSEPYAMNYIVTRDSEGKTHYIISKSIEKISKSEIFQFKLEE